LLIYSRSGRMTIIEQTNFPEVLKEALKNLSVKIKSSKAKITFDSTSEIPLYGQHEDIVRVFINLISNSIKFKQSNKRPYIIISVNKVNKDDNFATFSVKDNGVGIAKEDHSKLFKMFQRLKNNESRGSGIGLAICKRIVEKHGGSIWIESDIDKGAKFCFTFPCTKEALVNASINSWG